MQMLDKTKKKSVNLADEIVEYYKMLYDLNNRLINKMCVLETYILYEDNVIIFRSNY